MSAVPSAPRTARYESLDMWRGLACLMVLVNHALVYQLPEGAVADGLDRFYLACASIASRLWVGVPIFFVISGYCISASADSHRRKEAPVRTYFLKRFRRIFPPYWVVLVAMAGLVGVGDVLLRGALTSGGPLLRPWWYSPAQWLGSLSLTETWRTHLTGGQKALVLGPAWTLCYEEQFYAVCGALLLVCPRRFFLGAAAVSGAVVATALGASYANVSVEGFFFDGGWLQFAFGILIYYVLNYGTAKHRWLAALGFALVAVLTSSHWRELLDVQKNPYQEFWVASTFALAALYLHPFDGRFLTAAALQPIRTCGLMCYSLYLTHVPVINLMRGGLRAVGIPTGAIAPFIALPLFAVPALWIAWQFHLLVERRFMSSPPAAGARRSVVAAAGAMEASPI